MVRATVGAVAAVLVSVVAGCGAVDKGSAFAAEIEPLLEERELVETSRVVASSSLPWTGTGTVYVTLVPGLGDDEMVEEIWEITHLEVDNQIGYTLQVLFPSETADGGTATAGVGLRVPEPAPDEDGPREQIRERIGLARDLAALGTGETVTSPGVSSSRFDTEADAVAVALAICADDDLAEALSGLTISGVASDGGANRVKLGGRADCDWVPDVNDLVEVADSLGPVSIIEAAFESWDERPELRVTFLPPTPVDVSGLQAMADEAGITLVVV